MRRAPTLLDVGIERGRPGGRPEDVPRYFEERRSWRSSFVGTASLSCPRCDSPAPLMEHPAAPSSPLGCPSCAPAGAVRVFLSLGEPLRAPRVNVFVRI